MKRLVLFVEGHGDVAAAPILVNRIIGEQNGWDAVIPDRSPFRVGGFEKLLRNDFGEWKRYLAAAAKRPKFGGCLLILDGDSKAMIGENPFCAVHAARILGEHAREIGAGALFSVAMVFACMEFESWLIAGIESLSGQLLPGDRAGVNEGVSPPALDLEVAPRDAKGWLRGRMASGYSATRDQAELTQVVDLDQIRNRPMRSFRRLENAIAQIVCAFRSGTHIVSPIPLEKAS